MRELTEGQLQPAAQKLADQAMPLAKGVTDGALRPAAQQVADQVCLTALGYHLHTSSVASEEGKASVNTSIVYDVCDDDGKRGRWQQVVLL